MNKLNDIVSSVVFLLTSMAALSQAPTPHSIFVQSEFSPPSLPMMTWTPSLLGARFIENRGQVADPKGNLCPEVKYFTDAMNGVRIYFSSASISYVFTQFDPVEEKRGGEITAMQNVKWGRHAPHSVKQTLYRMDMDFVGARNASEIVREGGSQDYTNYYYAHCPDGVTHVRSYASLTYKNIYPNIDLVYRQNANGVKYDLVVHPGGSVSDIELQYNGAKSVEATREGRIRVTNPMGTVEEDVPYTYQPMSGGTNVFPSVALISLGANSQPILAAYHVDGNIVSFQIGQYDHSRNLIIDPSLSWCSYFGGSDYDVGTAVSVDNSSNIIVAGSTSSSDFPVTVGAFQTNFGGGSYDAFVSKFDKYGALQWTTFCGGSAGDDAAGIATDGNDNIVIAGVTSSSNFPVSASAFQKTFGGGARDAFVMKLNSSGARQWATYLGGSDGDESQALSIDPSGNIVTGGSTQSTNFPVTTGAFQTSLNATGTSPANAFVAKFDGGGNRKWATYYGGNATNSGDAIDGLATDASGNIFATGATGSTNFPITAGAFQTTFAGGQTNAFLVKFDGSGNQKWSTYYGGNGDNESGYSVATDANGDVFFTGVTWGKNFPVTTGAYQTTYGGGIGWYSGDAFLVKFDGSGNRKWATYYGADDSEWGTAVTSDASGNVIFTGWTGSKGTFPTTSDAYQSNLTGSSGSGPGYGAAVIVKFDGNGNRKWASEFGSTGGGQVETSGKGIATDAFGNIIITGSTNATTDFPVTPGAYQTKNNGKEDAFIAKFCINTPSYTQGIKTDTICRGSSIKIGNGTASGGSGSYTYSWTPTKWLSASTIVAPIATPDSTIKYYIEICDSYGCCAYDSTSVFVRQLPVANAGPDNSICPGDSMKLLGGATGGTAPYSFLWNPSSGLSAGNIARPNASPKLTTNYVLTVTDTFGCQSRDTMILTVFPQVIAHPGKGFALCLGDTGQIAGTPATGGAAPFTYGWSPSIGLSSTNILTPRAFPDKTVTYILRATDANGCIGTDSVVVTVNHPPFVNPSANADQTICGGTPVTIGGPASGGTPPYTYQWSPATGLSATNIAAPEARPITTTSYSVIVTDANGCHDLGGLVLRVLPAPNPIVTTFPASICAGDSATFKADSGYTAYVWSTGEHAPSIRVGDGKARTVRVTSQNGCKGTSAPESVYVRALPPAPHVSVSGDTGFCDGGNVELSVPSGNWTYLWSTGSTQPSITVTKSGTYTVRVGDNNTGCTNTSSPVTIVAYPNPAPVVVGPQEVCTNSTVSYTLTDTVVRSEAKTYVWTVSSGGTMTSGAGTPAITVRWGAAGQERVSVVVTTQSTHCTGASKPLAVTVGTSLKPAITVRGSRTLCGADTVTLDAGNGYVTYRWSTGAVTQTLTVTTPGTYAVNVSDATGCSGTSDSITIIAGAPPAPVIAGLDNVCTNAAMRYAVTDITGDGYVWNVTGGTIASGAGTNAITVQWGGAGSGSVAISETRGNCKGNATMTVTIGSGIRPVITASGPLTFCVGDSVKLTAPVGFSAYLWSRGDTTQSIVVKASGTYTVTVTGAGCTGTSAAMDVAVGNSLLPVITGPTAFCAGDSSALDAGAGYTTYAWSTGATTETIVVRASGVYGVSVTKGSCAGTSAGTVVTVYPSPAPPIITQRGDTLVSTAAATYQWLINGTKIAAANAQTLVITQSGAYTVAITDARGCAATSTAFTAVATIARATVTLELPKFSASLGAHIDIPLTLVTSNNLFDGGAQRFTAVYHCIRGMLRPDDRASAHDSAGATYITVRGALPGPQGILATSGCIALVTDTDRTALVIDTMYLDNGAVAVTRIDGELTVTGYCPTTPPSKIVFAGASLQQNSPNPFAGRSDIECMFSAPTHALLTVTDILGRTVMTLVDADIPAGRFIAHVNAAQLMSGMYSYVLRTPSQILRRTMHVEK